MSQWQTHSGHPVPRLQVVILTAPNADRMSKERSAAGGEDCKLCGEGG